MDLCAPHQTAAQARHCVAAILDAPVSFPRLVIPDTHSRSPALSRISSIVRLL